MTPQEIVSAARECLDTPFRHQGRLLGIGMDCAGVAVYVAQKWYPVLEPAAYSRLPNNKQLEFWLKQQPYLEKVNTPEVGDILLMRFGLEPQHLAICAGDMMIHSYERVGKVTEHLMNDVWRKRVVAVYRFKAKTTV